MKISYYNIGCKVNFAEISQIQKQFEDLGHKTVDFGSFSDAVIINTCTVTQQADADCRKIIRRAHKSNPEAFIGVIGCYAQIKPEILSEIEGVSAIVGTKQKYLLPKILEEYTKTSEPVVFVDDLDDLPYHSAISTENDNRTRVVLKIQDGCDYVCSYCTIPLARGKSRSLPFDSLKSTLLSFADSDFYEIILSGINIGDYRTSDGRKFEDVVRLIEDLPLKQRFRISSIEPNLLTDEILQLIKNSSKFCPHFHIPLQSGSPDILRAMRRRYKNELFAELVTKIRSEMPDACIGADVITGLPGETENHFKETYSFLEELPVTYLHAFSYSERDFTDSVKMSGKVSSLDKKIRTNALRHLSDFKKEQFYNSQIGTIRTTIPETYNAQTGLWDGWTENYVRVAFPESPDLPKIPLKIKLNNLSGEFVFCKVKS